MVKNPAGRILGPLDTAIVVRGSGDVELILPCKPKSKEVSPDQIALISFADAFRNERVRAVLSEIWEKGQPA